MKFLFNLILISAIAFLLFSCGNSNEPDSDEFVIKGKLSNTKSETVYLDELLINKTQTIDSTSLNEEGEFYFKAQIKEPGFYLLRIKDRNYITLLLKPGETIDVTGDALNLEKTYQVAGSDDCAEIQRMYMHYYINLTKIDSLRNIYLESQSRPDFSQFRDQLDSSYMVVFNDQKKFIYNFITKNQQSLISILALYQTFGQQRVISPEDELRFSDMVDKNLFQKYPKNKHLVFLHQRVSEMKRTFTEQTLKEQRLQIGAIAPDFAIYTIKGDTLRLSSLKGKKVLLSFWAPRCEECVVLNKRLQVRYEKYKPLGFEIVSMAVEDNKDFWKKAVADINMPWINGNDLNGLNSPLLTLYDLDNNFPHNFLLDAQGRIVSKGLQSDSLFVQIRNMFYNDTIASK